MGSRKKDYLKGVEWIDGQYITANGNVRTSSTGKYTVNTIRIDEEGIYLLRGIQTGGGSINYRIHQYDTNDEWVKQLQINVFTKGNIEYQINISEPMYIRLSIANTFEGTLTKM